jgi:hypothetical protein
MLVYKDLIQGSDEWLKARLGILTASNFSKILTPAKMKRSDSADKEENKLVAEIITGKLQKQYKSDAMQEGNENEPIAIDCYEELNGITVDRVGFIIDDLGRYGCSPDGLVGDDGMVEAKCVQANTMVEYMLKQDAYKEFANKYNSQVQGQLWVAERKWCDRFIWNEDLGHLQVRIERNKEFIARLETEVMTSLDNIKAKLQRLGHGNKILW